MHRSSAILRRVRQEIAEPGPGLSMLFELERRADHGKRRLIARHAREPLSAADGIGKLLAVPLLEVRLVIEQVQLRRSARHEQVNDPFGLGRMVRLAENAAIGFGRRFLTKQIGQRDAAESDAGLREERATMLGERCEGHA